jgi:hypothetical protein
VASPRHKSDLAQGLAFRRQQSGFTLNSVGSPPGLFSLLKPLRGMSASPENDPLRISRRR